MREVLMVVLPRRQILYLMDLVRGLVQVRNKGIRVRYSK